MKTKFLKVAFLLLAACRQGSDRVVNTAYTPEPVEIDTLRVPERMLRNIYYREEESSFPQFRGISDTAFLNMLNAQALFNYARFANSAKAESGLTSVDEVESAELLQATPASCRASFQVLCKNDSLISIVQYFISYVGHGGNSWTPASAVMNVDLKNRRLLKSSLADFPYLPFRELNERVVKYFSNIYPGLDAFNGLEELKGSPEKLPFAIRNDSLILVLEAYPGSHSSFKTYLIPVEKMTEIP